MYIQMLLIDLPKQRKIRMNELKVVVCLNSFYFDRYVIHGL